MPVWLGVDPQTGAPLWQKITKDADGNITSKEATSNYADATLQEVGSALPKYQGGFTNTFTYKNFSLSVNAILFIWQQSLQQRFAFCNE